MGRGAAAGGLPRRACATVTQERGVVLILDEVITGFRWSRGGAQARFGVTPDLCVLAKIVAGGLPGGAVAGEDIMDQLDLQAAAAAGREKIGHQGTFNSNPLCAAAAVATLSIVEREDVCAKAEATAAAIRTGMREILAEEGVPWGVYGDASAFLIFQNPNGLDIDPKTFDPLRYGFKELKGTRNARQKPPAAHCDAGERRRHHGRAGRAGLGRAWRRTKSRARSTRSGPACAGSRPSATSRPEAQEQSSACVVIGHTPREDAMLTRHSAAAAIALCAFIPALAQDSTGSTDFWPPPVRATAAYPIRQDASQWLGSNLIGARVVSASNQTIGKVANLVINEDGAIEAAVIAVGGVLGIGRKDVAVTYKSLNIVRNAGGRCDRPRHAGGGEERAPARGGVQDAAPAAQRRDRRAGATRTRRPRSVSRRGIAAAHRAR